MVALTLILGIAGIIISSDFEKEYMIVSYLRLYPVHCIVRRFALFSSIMAKGNHNIC